MKRPFAAFALAMLALTALAGGASATHVSGGGPTTDFARGSAKYQEGKYDFDGDGKYDHTGYQVQLQVNATEDPSTYDAINDPWPAQGTWSWVSPNEAVQSTGGEVTCLRVIRGEEGGPDIAWVGGRIDRGSIADGGSLGHDGNGIVLELIDNGPGENDHVRSWTAYVKDEDLRSCTPPTPGDEVPEWYTPFVYEKGNFVVHDAGS